MPSPFAHYWHHYLFALYKRTHLCFVRISSLMHMEDFVIRDVALVFLHRLIPSTSSRKQWEELRPLISSLWSREQAVMWSRCLSNYKTKNKMWKHLKRKHQLRAINTTSATTAAFSGVEYSILYLSKVDLIDSKTSSFNCQKLSPCRSRDPQEEEGDSTVEVDVQPPYPFNQSLLSSEESEDDDQEEATDPSASPWHPKPLGVSGEWNGHSSS